jgi:hypothetical protein
MDSKTDSLHMDIRRLQWLLQYMGITEGESKQLKEICRVSDYG